VLYSKLKLAFYYKKIIFAYFKRFTFLLLGRGQMEVKQSSKGFPSASLFLVFVTILFLCNPYYSFAQGVEVFEDLGITGGHIYDIAIDPENPDKMFAGAYLGDGLYMTMGGGNTWQAVETNGVVPGQDEFKNHTVFAVEMAPGDPQVIWVAHKVWVEKSIDGGQTWTHISNSAMQLDCVNCGGPDDDFRFCMSLAIDPDDSDIVYVGTAGPGNSYTNGAIYKTVDGGTSWTKMNQGNNFDFPVVGIDVGIDIDPQENHIIYAVTNSNGRTGWGGTGGTLYRSDDSGNTWGTVLSLTQYQRSYDTVVVKPDADDPEIVLTGGNNGIIVFKISNGEEPIISQPCFLQDCLNVYDISFDPQNPDTVYATWYYYGGKVAKSIDGGDTWETFPNDYAFETLAVHPKNSEVVFAGEFNEGIYKSEDYGQTWLPINDGINAVIIYDVAIDPNDSTHILAATFAGLYEKSATGSWLQRTRYSTHAILFHPTDSQIFFAGLEGWFMKSFDGGQNWSYSNWVGDVEDIAIDRTNTNLIFIAVSGSPGKIYKSENEGDSFYEVLVGENQSGEKYPFNVVAIDPNDNQHIFAGGGNFYASNVIGPGDLWESRDGGGNWTQTSLQNKIINALLIDPRNSDIMYAGAGYSGGMRGQNEAPLYKSTDGGISWTASYEGIPGYPTPWNAVTDLAFHRQDSHIIYASTNLQGIFVSNQARKWMSLGTPEYNVYSIATASLYSGTQGGLFQLTGTGIIAGKITDSDSHLVDNAIVFNDMGMVTRSVNGEYIMVAPAGIYSVTSIADNYANEVTENETVYGGDVTWVDFTMQSGISDRSAIPDQYVENSSGVGAGKACFVATAAYGSPMSGQVEILRKFRDGYLLPYDPGRRLVSFYYRTGEPAAAYINSHPWLKSPVRVILYPVIGFAWLMLSTSVVGKSLVAVCFLTGFVFVIRKLKSNCNYER
jgi:photosystem II stability/assembly factor-like uncharacterized protein